MTSRCTEVFQEIYETLSKEHEDRMITVSRFYQHLGTNHTLDKKSMFLRLYTQKGYLEFVPLKTDTSSFDPKEKFYITLDGSKAWETWMRSTIEPKPDFC